MFKGQNGLYPAITTVAGLVLFVYPTFVVLVNAIYNMASDFALANVLTTFLASIIVLLIPIEISLFLLKMFPSIRANEIGVRYFSFPLSIRVIRWEEIESLTYFQNGYAALILQKKGLTLLNGLYFHKLYGMMLGVIDPIILLAPNILDQTDLLAKLREKKISITERRKL